MPDDDNAADKLQAELDRRTAGMAKYFDDALAQVREDVDRRFRETRDMSNERREDLRLSVAQQFADLKENLDERQQATQVALEAALLSQEKYTDAAFASADKAVSKAESAAERRFESVNEFRAQLTDQTASFLRRAEYQAAHDALEDKLETVTNGITDRINSELKRSGDERSSLELRLTSRLDTMAGRDVGGSEHRDSQRLNVNTILQFLAFVAVTVGIVIAILHGG